MAAGKPAGKVLACMYAWRAHGPHIYILCAQKSRSPFHAFFRGRAFRTPVFLSLKEDIETGLGDGRLYRITFLQFTM